MFKCKKCGACCEAIGTVIDRFPLPIREIIKVNKLGHCVHYQDGLCAIYEQRPLLCNVNKSIDAFQKDYRELLEKSTAECCELLQKERENNVIKTNTD